MWASESVEKRLVELRSKSEEFAKAFADRSHLDNYTKSLLAIQMKKAEEDGHKTTAAQEREARASEAYIEHLEGLRVAIEQSERLRWELEVAKLGIAVWQTLRADERMEKRAYG
jgi:hypothetical protein